MTVPSMYELSEEECGAIAHALMYWVKVRSPGESALSDWQVLQIIAKLAFEEKINVNHK